MTYRYQTDAWELSVGLAKKQFGDHEQQFWAHDPRDSSVGELPISTQNTSRARTNVNFVHEEDIHYANTTPLNSCRVSGINKTVTPQSNGTEQYNSCVASDCGMQKGGLTQQAENSSTVWIAATNTKDVAAAATSRKCLNAGLRDIMARHLGLNTEIQNQNKCAPSTETHTRTFSTSSRPSLSSSFASASSTDITTPVFENNEFEMLSWDGAMPPNQPISMPNISCERKMFKMPSRDCLVLDHYQEHEEVSDRASSFIPSAILKGGCRVPKPDMARKAAEVGIALNPNYKGELTNFNLRNAMCLDHENCSVRIHNIHPEANRSEIFAIITHGKVFSFNYIPSVENLFNHAAADLVFLTREAAEDFIYDAQFGRGIYIRGEKIKVLWNRVKVMPAEGRYEKMSRVVRVKGPADDFSVRTLEEFFRSKFEFDLITSKEWIQWDGCKIVELAFSSIRSQSESAVKSFNLYVNQNMPNAGYRIWYAPDPCFKPDHGRNLQSSGNRR